MGTCKYTKIHDAMSDMNKASISLMEAALTQIKEQPAAMNYNAWKVAEMSVNLHKQAMRLMKHHAEIDS